MGTSTIENSEWLQILQHDMQKNRFGNNNLNHCWKQWYSNIFQFYLAIAASNVYIDVFCCLPIAWPWWRVLRIDHVNGSFALVKTFYFRFVCKITLPPVVFPRHVFVTPNCSQTWNIQVTFWVLKWMNNLAVRTVYSASIHLEGIDHFWMSKCCRFDLFHLIKIR